MKIRMLILAAFIAALGVFQTVRWQGEKGREAAMGKVSGIFAVMSSLGIAIYAIRLKGKA